MTKTLLLTRAVQYFKLDEDDSILLKKELAEYAKQNESLTIEELSLAIKKDLPHLQLLHDASLRRYARVTANNSSVIKVIIVIYFIASIIAGLSIVKW